MSPTSMDPNKIRIEDLVSVVNGIQATSNTLQELLRDTFALNTTLTSIRIELEQLQDDVSTLLKLVRDGNGKESLLSRMDKVTDKVLVIEKNLDDHLVKAEQTKDKIETRITAFTEATESSKTQTKVVELNGRWNLRIAVIVIFCEALAKGATALWHLIEAKLI